MLQEKVRLNNTYTLIRKLGSGGGGVVYQAYHERLQTYVVVKQIRERVKGRINNRAEADILKNIKHTYLPRVYDFLEINGEVFTVMDFVPGLSFAQALEQRGRFPQKDVLKWAHQLAEALKYLHGQVPPIIHSDIKPANIMLTPDGNICLIDFNISLAFDQGMRTSTGTSAGYSPPEQYRSFQSYDEKRKKRTASEWMQTETMTGASSTLSMGRNTSFVQAGRNTGLTQTDSLIAAIAGRGVDERSDIYSLGATIYHLLTGIKPSIDYERMLPITAYDMELGEGFGTIINKMMALDPACRYQNGGELLNALDHIYELDQEYQHYRKGRRTARLLIALLYAAGALTAGIGWGVMQKETVTAYNRAVEQANELIQAEDFEEAEIMIQDAVTMLPGRIGAYEKELLRLYAMGEYAETIQYGKDIVNHPAYEINHTGDEITLGNIFYVLGNAYMEEADYANAAGCFAEAISRNQNNSLYFRDQAIALAKTGNIKQAENALEQAEDLGLGKDSVYMVQGEIAFAKGEDKEAVKYLRQSILTAESSELWRRAVILCVQAYKRIGNEAIDEEIALLEDSIRSLGLESSMQISEQLADAYVRKAQSGPEFADIFYSKALEEFQKLYKQGHSTRQVMENIAVVYQQMDRLEESEEMLNQILEKYPEDYRAYKRLAFLEADKQQKKENKDRDYRKMDELAEKAQELYKESKIEGDGEILMLERMREELRDGGWLE